VLFKTSHYQSRPDRQRVTMVHVKHGRVISNMMMVQDKYVNIQQRGEL
jgi:hypothetical protein